MSGETGDARCRILLVDDDDGVRELFLRGLRRRGFLVRGACDGAQALLDLTADTFDVVVTDLQMPRVDGLSLLRELRRRGSLLPVVVQTSVPNALLAIALAEAGAYATLLKGSLDDLTRTVEAAWGAAKSAA